MTSKSSLAIESFIAASHSEVILNEAADRDLVVAFVGVPHRIDDRGSQVLKALKDIGFDHYYQAEETGWVLYLEGSTDLAMLTALAGRLDHPVQEHLERPFVHYVGNQPRSAKDHFHGLRRAKPDLVGCAVYDRLDQSLPSDVYLTQVMWRRREFENYICQRETLLAFAQAEGRRQVGDLFAEPWKSAMEKSIDDIVEALEKLGKPEPWQGDVKASDEFLDPLFKRFYASLKLPNLMRKTDYHILVPHVSREHLDREIVEKLNAIQTVAEAAKPVRAEE